MSRTSTVGRYRVTFTCPVPRVGATLMLSCDWEPSLPAALTPRELRSYRSARDAFVAEVAAVVGGAAAVVEAQ